MKLDKATGTKIFVGSALVPIVIFLVIYLTGFSGWATAAMRFQECSNGLVKVLSATAAMLHIVIALLLLLSLVFCLATLLKGWKPFAASLIIQVFVMYFFYKMAMPGNFAFAWTDSVLSCSASWSAPLTLALAFFGACLSLGLSGFCGVMAGVSIIFRGDTGEK